MLQMRESSENNYLQVCCAGNLKQTARGGIKMLTGDQRSVWENVNKDKDKALWQCNHG